MSAKIIKQNGSKLTIEVELDLKGDMLTEEEGIQRALNEAGKLATKVALERRDTDGCVLQVGNKRMTSKGSKKKSY